MKKRNLKHNSSGQVIIITALLVASLLLSTAIYVFETEKEVPTTDTEENNVFPAYQQSTINTLISVLANVTGGGNSGVLTADLNELTGAITNDSYQAILQMNYTPLNVDPYQNGIGFLGVPMVKESQVLMSVLSLTLQHLQHLPIWNIM